MNDELRQAKEILEQGGIILYPTDTVYGLGVNALNVDAVQKLSAFKGRDNKAFSVIVDSLQDAEKFVELNEGAYILAGKFLPGSLTIILPKKDIVPDTLTGGRSGLGIRIPDNKFCLELAKEFGRPFVTTSANVSGKETKSTVPEILEQFSERVGMIDYVVDVGEVQSAKPSTVVDMSTGKPVIVREGSISEEEIQRALNTG